MLFTYWTMVLGGLGLHGDFDDISLITVICISFGMGAANLLNLVNDIEADRLNQKLPWIYHGLITPKRVVIYLIILYIFGLGGLAVQGGMMTFLTSVVLFGGLGLLYNIGPSPLKRKPLLSLLMSALIGGGLWIVGAVAVGGILEITMMSLARYTSAWTAVCLISMIPDIKGDRETGKITFAVKFGAKLTTRFSLVLILISLAYSIFSMDLVLLAPAVISFPFFLTASFSGNIKWITLAAKSSVLTLSIMVAINYVPQYFILIAIYFFLARWYYRTRFNLIYPSLK